MVGIRSKAKKKHPHMRGEDLSKNKGGAMGMKHPHMRGEDSVGLLGL